MSEPQNSSARRLALLLMIGCGILIVVVAILPSLSGGGPSPTRKIVTNLRQIELAKKLWAEAHNATNGTPVSQEDLAPYFPSGAKPGQLVPPVYGERYLINNIGAAPEAFLNRRVRGWPKGTIIRLQGTTNGFFQVLPPDERSALDTRAALCFHVERHRPDAGESER